jgi:hypothetical protein
MDEAAVPAVIFLDVDGVLHPLSPNHLPLHADPADLSARADEELAEAIHPKQDALSPITRVVEGEFLPECMKELKRIVDMCGASIVLSTTWRETEAGRAAVKQQLDKAGIPASKVIGCTPHFESNSRAAEISDWVSTHSITRYVALDDMEMDLDQSHFVRTDMGCGLTAADATLAIKILGS